MKKTIITSALALMSISAFADTSIPDVKSQMKVTANVAAGCDLTAENINFGVLSMPLTAQSASANIQIQCSKGATVNLGISYSNSVSSINSTGSIKAVEITSGTNSTSKNYDIYIDGVLLSREGERSSIQCGPAYSLTGYEDKIVLRTAEIVALYGNPKLYMGQWYYDSKNLCDGREINQSVLKSLYVAPSIGSMIGQAAGETITYSLSLPNDSSKIWNPSNKYEFVTSGENQLIPMKATIDTATSPTHRLSPDTYVGNITVVLNY